MRLLYIALLSALIAPCFSQSLLPGYKSAIAGENLVYHSPQPDADTSLLVRSEDSARYIEWQTCKVDLTGDLTGPPAFLMLAGIDVNPADPHQWKVFVNDRHFFTISTPTDTLTKKFYWNGPEESLLTFQAKEVDKYGDFMGYLFCTLPSSVAQPGKPVTFRVVGESAGSRTWFMVFKYETVDKVTLTAEQAVERGKKQNSQVLRAEIVRYAERVEARITIAGKKIDKTLDFGYNSLYLPVPQIKNDTTLSMSIRSGKTVLADQTFLLHPVKQRTIYLLHHSHNDIGYTDIQTKVEQKQWDNLDRAIVLGDSTKDFPPGSRFKWCSEIMWAAEYFYFRADSAKKEAFREAVRTGTIELDGLFGNELTSLCGPEELDRLLEAGRRISRECGTQLTSAMITDIPGWSWALVPALANSGVKYLSLGTNRDARMGNILKTWGDKPFYWVSPSGEEKVLCWMHGEGYSLFHTGLAYTTIRKRLQEELVFDYLNKLSAENYPYEEVMLRYNIGSDNGPVDETLPGAVKEWNEKYVTPQIMISTVDEAFSTFEKNHGTELPKFSGDLTCYWEDGAYSTAKETIMNRATASRLVQAQALWAMYNPAGYSEVKFRDAWRNVLLFDEHTWGSWNSISEPYAPFTTQQWDIKKSFALDADKMSKKVMIDAMISKMLGGPAADAVEVINTCGWTRSGLATFSGGAQGSQVKLTDVEGNEIPTQTLSDGNIAFIAKDIPALGSKIFKIKSQPTGQSPIKPPNPPIPQSPNPPIPQSPNPPIPQSPNPPIFQTSRFSLNIDPQTGAISSLTWKPSGEEMVDTSRYAGLNEYLYVDGRLPSSPLKSKLVNISVTEDGPVMKAIRIETEAPGCNSQASTIRLFDGLDLVEVIDEFERKKVLTPEAVHLAFPFSIPGGIMRYDLAYGYCRPEKDQLPGSNKNFLAMEHWLDISGDKAGVTVICPDAPLFEAGNITMDEIVYGWVDSIAPTQTFFSYAMNNYWETNFAASQEGPVTFRYVIMPHGSFDPAGAEKAAIGQRQPLLSRKGGGWQKEKASLLKLRNGGLIITSVKPVNQGKEILITVYNAGTENEFPQWENTFRMIFLSDPDGLKEQAFDENEAVPPGGIRYFKVTL